MAMSSTRRMPSSGGKTKIQKLEVDQFARRLYELMNAQGLSQSDLAKKAFGTKVDVHLEVNKLVPMALASKIISMISEYDEINNSK